MVNKRVLGTVPIDSHGMSNVINSINVNILSKAAY